MWTDGILISFDTETTGVDPETARIVTASVVVIKPGRAPETYEWLVNPGIDIPDEAAKVHGVTTEHAREHGQAPEVVIGEIVECIHDEWCTTVPLIVYNAPYDLTLLNRELRRHCDELWMPRLPVVDPLVLDRALDRYRRGKRTLSAVSAHYGVPISEVDAHGSTADALCAARVAWRIGRMFPAECDDLETLQIRQRAWHREWAEHFGEYLRGKGQPDDVGRDWPWRPAPVEAERAGVGQ